MILALTLTLTFGSWVIPVITTIIGIILIGIVSYRDRKSGGWFSGLETAFIVFAVFPAVLITWIVWLLMAFVFNKG